MTSLSGLLAFQQNSTLPDNNIANANTPGYSRESVNLVSVPGPYIGGVSTGNGVAVNGVQRIFDQTVASQVVSEYCHQRLHTTSSIVFPARGVCRQSARQYVTNGLASQLQSLRVFSPPQIVANAPTEVPGFAPGRSSASSGSW